MDKKQKPARQKGSGKKAVWITVGCVVAAAAIIGGGYFGYTVYHSRQVLAQEVQTARDLVLFNPLADGPAAVKLAKKLPAVGEQTTNEQLYKNLQGTDFKKLLTAAQKEVAAKQKSQLSEQASLNTKTDSKLAKLAKDKNFPQDSADSKKQLDTLVKTFDGSKDAVGMNIANAGLETLAGETTEFIQEKTRTQIANEKARKKTAAEVAKAAKDGTYPSLGMLRGDLPNGIGVIPMQLMPGGPSDNVGMNTSDEWDDSSVIVAINGRKVQSAIIGPHSMQSVLKATPGNTEAHVKFLDGSEKTVKLDLKQNDAAKYHYDDLPDPGTDTDTDLTLGVSGYNIGQKHKNKEIGLVITAIDSDGPAADSDLKVGDTICKVDEYWVGTTQDLKKILTNYYSDDSVTIDYVTASGHLKTTDITLED